MDSNNERFMVSKATYKFIGYKFFPKTIQKIYAQLV